MLEPQVTVVIVNYNSGEMLTTCVEQALKSTVPIKIIISDNASTDKSLEKLQDAFKDNASIYIHKNAANLGFSAANNAVFGLISSPFVLYLNPDCFIQENTIEHFLDLMKENPKAGVIGCLVTNTDGTEQKGCRGLTPTPSRVFFQMLAFKKLIPSWPSGYLLHDTPLPSKPIEVELISGSCMFIRKEAIENTGLLDENYFLYCEDYDWFYRFLSKKWSILFTPLTQVSHIKSYSTKKIPFKVLLYKARGMWRYHNKFYKENSFFITTLIIRLGIICRLMSLGTLLVFQELKGKIAQNLRRGPKSITE